MILQIGALLNVYIYASIYTFTIIILVGFINRELLAYMLDMNVEHLTNKNMIRIGIVGGILWPYTFVLFVCVTLFAIFY